MDINACYVTLLPGGRILLTSAEEAQSEGEGHFLFINVKGIRMQGEDCQ